ncbi:MAG: hypothetical protein JWO06_994 [Bacteroidota bacterium]|nr:hypothetical protein [Bacteroidota bacterium]
MKQIIPWFLVLCVWVTVVKQSSAQCLPDLSSCTLKHPGDPLCMVPDTNEMTTGYVGQAYDRCIHFIFENSFTVSSNPMTGQQLPFPVTASLGYMVFDSIGGLPPGITYEMTSGNPNDPPGKFSPDGNNKAYGCIHLHGLPTQSNTPTSDTAKIYSKPHGCVLGGVLCGDFPWPIIYHVPMADVQGITEPEAMGLVNIIPQRSNNSLQVECDATANAKVKFSVFDVIGRTLMTQSVNVIAGRNEVMLNFSAGTGFYILQLSTDNGSSSHRFAW